MSRRTWSLRQARERFGEVVEAARRKPQIVTERGKPAVVIVAAAEYERLRKLRLLKRPSFTEMLLSMPRGDVEFDRLQTRIRDVTF